MSHIIKDKEDLLLLQNLFSEVSGKKLDSDLLQYLLEKLIPKDKNNKPKTHYVINNSHNRGQFIARYNTIYLSLDYLNMWVKENNKDLLQEFSIKKSTNLEDYLKIYIILHEIEHSYQYLISKGLEPAPNQLVKEGYAKLIDILLPNQELIPNLIKRLQKMKSRMLYYQKADNYVLERNANYETTSILTELALNNGDIIPSKVFKSFTYGLMKIGYTEDELGCLYHTFEGLKMLKSYKRIKEDKDLDFQEKVRYGLKISPKQREELLKM